MPSDKALNAAPDMVAVSPSLAELKAPSDAAIAVPAPLALTESIKNSAAAILLLGEASFAVAVIVGAVLVGVGVITGIVVVGATVSTFTVTLLVWKLPALSLAFAVIV